MKLFRSIFILAFCFQIFTVNSSAQENYESVTFTIPKDRQKKTQPNSLNLLKAGEAGEGGLIIVLKPVTTDFGSKTNFAIWWNAVVRKVVNATETAP